MSPLAVDRTVLALGLALLHFLWQGTALAVLARVGLGALRGARPEARYLVGCVTLALMLAAPIATFLVLREDSRAAVARLAPAPTVEERLAAGGAAPQEGVGQVRSRTRRDPAAAPVTPPAGVASWLRPAWPAVSGDAVRAPLAALTPWLVAVWCAGVVLLSLRLLGGWTLARRLGRAAVQRPVEELAPIVARLSARLGVTRAVRICRSAKVEVPTLVGWIKPVILLPGSALTGLPPDQLEALVAHELAHVRRHDVLVNLFQSAVETLLFYHPAVWWLSARVRAERENCCDDLAVSACGDRLVYARALFELERLRGPETSLAMAASGGSLIERVRRVLGAPRPDAGGPRWLPGLAMLGLLLALVASGVGLTVGTAETREPARKALRAAQRLVGLEPASPPALAEGVAPLDPDLDVDFDRALAIRPLEPRAAQELERAILLELGRDDTDFEDAADVADLADAADAADEDSDEEAEETAEPEEVDPQMRALIAVGGFTCDDAACPQAAAPGHPASCPAVAAQLAAIGVQPSTLTALAPLGLGPQRHEELATLVGHGVEATYLATLRETGVRVKSTAEIAELAAAGVSREQVEALRWLEVAPDVKALVKLQQSGVDADYVAGLRSLGYRRLSPEDLVQLRQFGVSLDLVAQLRAVGLRALPASDLTRLSTHGITARWLAGFRAVGFASLNVDQLIALITYDANAEYGMRLRGSGVADFTPENLVAMRLAGVTPETVRRAEQAGVASPTPAQLVRIAQGEDPKSWKSWKAGKR